MRGGEGIALGLGFARLCRDIGIVGDGGEGGKCAVGYCVADHPEFPIPMQSWNPSAMGERDLPRTRLVLLSPAGFVLLLRRDAGIAPGSRGD